MPLDLMSMPSVERDTNLLVTRSFSSVSDAYVRVALSNVTVAGSAEAACRSDDSREGEELTR